MLKVLDQGSALSPALPERHVREVWRGSKGSVGVSSKSFETLPRLLRYLGSTAGRYQSLADSLSWRMPEENFP